MTNTYNNWRETMEALQKRPIPTSTRKSEHSRKVQRSPASVARDFSSKLSASRPQRVSLSFKPPIVKCLQCGIFSTRPFWKTGTAHMLTNLITLNLSGERP